MNKAVYTIEAAVWVSMLLFIFMMAIQGGLDLYSEIVQEDISEEVQDFWAVNSFYIKNGIEGVFND